MLDESALLLLIDSTATLRIWVASSPLVLSLEFLHGSLFDELIAWIAYTSHFSFSSAYKFVLACRSRWSSPAHPLELLLDDDEAT